MRDIYLGGDKTAAESDAFLAALPKDEALALHLSGSLQTQGVYRWGRFASRNLGTGWTVDGDAEISLASPVGMDSQPIYCLAGPARSVSGITMRGNHSSLADGWRGTLRTGGVLLEGDGLIDKVTFRDFGSLGSETFVANISEGAGSAAITNCVFTDWVPSASDTQVTVFFIGGFRPFALMEGNDTRVSGAGNWVQGHTIYEASKGLVRNNRTSGARTGYYGDFFATRGITIEGNQFLGCEHGVQLQLSPTAGDDLEMPKYFSHENYTIGPNEIESSGANVLLDTLGPSTATRYIRFISVDASLSLENNGATNVTRTGVVARKGCNPFGFLHHR